MDEINCITNKKNIWIGLYLLIIVVAFFIDKGLSIGFCVLSFLAAISILFLYKLGLRDKKIYLLFLIVLAIHLGSTMFMYYANFQPFSGGTGDYLVYQKSAVEFSQSFRQGDFSIKDISSKYPDVFSANYYPVVVGSLYALTLPEEIIGLMLNVWLAAISIIFVYLIILEISGLSKNAFIIGLVAAIYPSYIFDTGLLLKEALEIFFVFLALLFLIKIIKKFNWYNFFVLYAATFCATHFRFYIGYALIIAFVSCWFLFSGMGIKKRIIYGIIFIILLGFIPQFSAGQGYLGVSSFKGYLNFNMVNFYRQVAYMPVSANPILSAVPGKSGGGTSVGLDSSGGTSVGLDSSFVAKSNVLGYVKSFVYVLLGPFPWQVKNLRQALALFETIPWYFLLFFVARGLIVSFKKRIKEVAPLLIFSVIAMVVVAVFSANFGIIARIRIPAFISLLCIASLGFNKNNIINNYLNKFNIWKNI